MQHKVWVYISLNEGLDLYEITLLTSNYRVLKTIEEVYCDQLAQIVDELVERSPGMPEAKSCKSCTNTSSIQYIHQHSQAGGAPNYPYALSAAASQLHP